MKPLFVFGILCLCACRGDDVKLPDGTTYHNAAVVSHDARAVTITSDDGPATFPFVYLPVATQRRILKAEEEKRESEAHQASAAAEAAKLALLDKEDRKIQIETLRAKKEEIENARRIIIGTVIEVLPDGLFIDCGLPGDHFNPAEVSGRVVLRNSAEQKTAAKDDQIYEEGWDAGRTTVFGGVYHSYSTTPPEPIPDVPDDSEAAAPTPPANNSQASNDFNHGSINDPVPSHTLPPSYRP